MYLPALLLVFFSAIQVKGQSSLGGIAVVDPTAPCTVCATGNPPDLDPDFAPFKGEEARTCQTIADEVAGLNAVNGDTSCKDRQLLAFQLGCCEFPVYDYCSVCPDGSEGAGSNIIPLGAEGIRDPACDSYQFQFNALTPLFSAGTCSDTLLQRSAHYCGCPDAEQQCFLCPDGEKASNPERGDAFVFQQRCKGVEFYFSLLTEDECGKAASIGVDYANFCRCNEYKKTSQAQCNLCSGGIAGIRNPDFIWRQENRPAVPFKRTCLEAQDFADSIISEEVCLREMAKPLAAGCECKGNGPEFVDSAAQGRAGMALLCLIVTFFASVLIS